MTGLSGPGRMVALVGTVMLLGCNSNRGTCFCGAEPGDPATVLVPFADTQQACDLEAQRRGVTCSFVGRGTLFSEP